MSKQPIRTITDEINGRQWRIFKKSDTEYYYKYYEFFKQLGWKYTCREGDHEKGYLSKEYIEYTFDIVVI